MAKTGQKTTLEEICNQFRSLEDTTHRFYFFDTSIPVYTGRNKFLLMIEHARQQLWKQVILPLKAWQKKCDVVYCNDYFAPIIHLNYKTVQLFHDALFFEYPQYCNKIWLLIFKGIAIPGARRSAYIITPTLYAKERLHHFTGIASEKIIPIHQGPKTITNSNEHNGLPDWLPTQNGFEYILHIGVLEKRKNLSNLIKAYKLFKDAGYHRFKLVIAGKGNGKIHSDDTEQVINTIKENGLEDDVILPGYLPDELLSTVYQNASLYVFPSINEGFGIPILEAFKCNTPVIVANNSSLPEVGGNAVLTFDPYDINDICAKMRKVIDYDLLRQELIQKGIERLALFTWKRAAEELLDVFEQAVALK